MSLQLYNCHKSHESVNKNSQIESSRNFAILYFLFVFVYFSLCLVCFSCTQPDEVEEPTSVLLPLLKSDSGSNQTQERSDVVPWQAPHIDWNPWTNRSAYVNSGPLAQLDPQSRAAQTSQLLFSELSDRKARDPALQKVRVEPCTCTCNQVHNIYYNVYYSLPEVVQWVGVVWAEFAHTKFEVAPSQCQCLWCVNAHGVCAKRILPPILLKACMQLPYYCNDEVG